MGTDDFMNGFCMTFVSFVWVLLTYMDTDDLYCGLNVVLILCVILI
jgi:hypothetical protein